MVIQEKKFEETLIDGRFSEAEIQCKGFLLAKAESGCDEVTMMSVLHCLAQALEGQGKVGEAYGTRIRVKQILTAKQFQDLRR
ncbi:MAG TPA: hypothetical protein PKZ32_15090 [Candidatus Melainabacteria bacterium]|jgi:hypothetical protein|nr:hypothetical protein [Candidatus Melainabacteria bacterium]